VTAAPMPITGALRFATTGDETRCVAGPKWDLAVESGGHVPQSMRITKSVFRRIEGGRRHASAGEGVKQHYQATISDCYTHLF